MRTILFPMMAISVGLSGLSSSSAQEVVAKKIVVGAIASVDKAAGTFTLDNKGEPLELTIHQNTDGASEIVKGRRVTVMYGQSLDSDETLALRVKPSKGVSKPASDDEPANAAPKTAGPKKVRATGIGVDADKARQAAFTLAVEQQVGLLVDSDTIVENDEVIRDVVRTFSKGKVDSFKVVKEWQEDGLFHATIEATVAVDQLADGLKARRIPVNQIEGEKIARQGDYDRTQKANASAIVSDDFPDYKVSDYLKAEIDGTPHIEGAETGVAKITVKVKVSSDMDKWLKMADQLTRTLRRTLPRNGIAVSSHARTIGRWVGGYYLKDAIPEQTLSAAVRKLKQRGGEWGYLVMVAKGVRDSGPDRRTFLWEGYEVPKDAFDKIDKQFKGRNYSVKVVLKDKDGEVVHEQEIPGMYGSRGIGSEPSPFSWLYLGPYHFMEPNDPYHSRAVDPLGYPLDVEMSFSSEDLKRVKEVTAEVIERTPDSNP